MGKNETRHGGIDPGANYKDIKESKINLEISQLLKDNLEKYGAIIYMTRNGDYDLSTPSSSNKKRSDLTMRAKLINESKCDMYISIHLNADTSSTWYGAQVFYTNQNKENQKIAKIIEKELQTNLKTNRKAKELKNMFLYEKLTTPGILLEAGFISNSNDRTLLTKKEYQQTIATTISNGIIKYFNSK